MGPVNRPLELQWLEDFLALAESGNFSRAAQSRGPPPPALPPPPQPHPTTGGGAGRRPPAGAAPPHWWRPPPALRSNASRGRRKATQGGADYGWYFQAPFSILTITRAR